MAGEPPRAQRHTGFARGIAENQPREPWFQNLYLQAGTAYASGFLPLRQAANAAYPQYYASSEFPLPTAGPATQFNA
jgi:hypothetical protein